MSKHAPCSQWRRAHAPRRACWPQRVGTAPRMPLQNRPLYQAVAVGTQVTSRPPHRSGHASFSHTAPTSGLTVKCFRTLPHVISCCDTCASTVSSCMALSPIRGPLISIPLGHRPSLHQLRCRSLRFVRRLHSYYGDVRLPVFVHHRLRILAPRCGPRYTTKPWPNTGPPSFRTRSFRA
jgi:hypothetical protein